jgi:hypothetical protein
MMRNKGFALITVMLFSLLMSGVVAILFWQVNSSAALGVHVSGQLHSLVVAENGLELARISLSAAPIDEILVGANGRLDSPIEGICRNPVSLDEARWTEPGRLSTSCDDGLLGNLGLTPRSPGYEVGPDEWVFLRVFNNPEEPPERDEDGIVTVRSVGVCAVDDPDGTVLGSGNHVTVVEARLRKESAFESDAALTLVGGPTTLAWETHGSAGDPPVKISVVEFPDPGLYEIVRSSLEASSSEQTFQLVNESRERLPDSAFHRVLGEDFWEGLDARLRSAQTGERGVLDRWDLHFLPDGGVISDQATGLFFSSGQLTITNSARLRGVVVHLGRGGVTLSGSALVQGALWMLSAPAAEPGESLSGSRLEVLDQARLEFDAEAVESALKFLPVTQIYWRLIFPEMFD